MGLLRKRNKDSIGLSAYVTFPSCPVSNLKCSIVFGINENIRADNYSNSQSVMA